MGKSAANEVELVSEKDMTDRENKYMQRLADISTSCNFIRESTMEYNRLQVLLAREQHWEHYIRCDGLPRPYLPPEMRTFLAKKRHYQQFDADHNVDWTLSVDETSILTQDIFRVDRTRLRMKGTHDEHIAQLFEKDITMFMESITKIDCMLDNNAEMARVEFKRQLEIMEVRSEIEREIDDSFDRLTYRIIRMDGVYLNSNDAMIATWGASCDIYAIDLWGLRNVPIRFDELAAPLMVADLNHVGVIVQMPLSVLHDCLTLRCVHTTFDNYSQYAKSFDPIILENSKDLHAGIVDIEESLIDEWNMQLEIQQELLQSMLEKRMVYEEFMLVIAEKMEKAAREKKANDGGQGGKAIAIPKAPKEPQAVPQGMLPEAYPAFLEREQEQYMEMLDTIYEPKNLKLRMDEINLRKHIMLGGIYSIMFVRRSGNTHFQKFNIILHEDGRVLHTMADVEADMSAPKDSEIYRKASKLSQLEARMSEVQLKSKRMHARQSVMLDSDDLPCFCVILQLPKDLCIWSEPICCQYMSGMEDIESETSISEPSAPTVPDKKETKKPKTSSVQHVTEALQRQSKLNQFERKGSSNVFRPTLISLLRNSKVGQPLDHVVAVRNFSLMKFLDHQEIRQLERYAVPRIMSSFKLPMEVREELEQADQRPKTRNILLRRRSADVEETKSIIDLDFDFDVQHAPERVFPIFHDLENVAYNSEDEEVDDYYDKKTLYGLLDTFDNIRLRYLTNYRNIMNQPDFQMKKLEKPKKAAMPVQAHDTRSTTSRTRSTIKSLIRIGSVRGTQGPGLLSTSASMTSNFRSPHGSMHSVMDTAEMLHDQAHVTTAKQSFENLVIVQEEEDKEKPKQKVIHWTTKHIIASKFDKANRTMTIRTDRLGIFGLAFKRYEHFPFRDWSMQPNEENPDEIILNVDTFHVRVILYITSLGVRGYVTDITKGYVANPVKYLDIQTPISDFRLLRRQFCEKNINIFAEHDASFYIDNGYFSMKHVATEDHIYDAMALHCKLMKFYRSSWNRLASRRNVLMCMKNAKDQSDYTEVTLRITPDQVTFVEVSELCSDDLDVIRLDFKTTWRNLSYYTDLHQAVVSMNPHATDVRNKDSLLLYQVKRMLNEIHIMSFS